MNSTNSSNKSVSLSSPFLPHFISSWEYYTYTSFVCVITVVAAALCILVLSVAYRSPKLRTVTNTFVFNLAAISLLGSTLALLFSVISVIFAATGYSPSQSFCKAVLFFSLYPLSVAMWGSAGIAMDRCDVMTRPLSRRLDHRKAKVIISFTWFLPMVLCIPGVVGWGSIVYQAENESEQVQCYIDPVKSFSFVVFWAVLGIICPTGLIVFCYSVIIHVINKKALTRRALMCIEPISRCEISADLAHFNKTEAQAFRIAFIVLLNNIVFTAPFVIVLLLKLDVAKGNVQVTHMITVIFLDICITINSFLYTFGVRSIRNEIEIMCHHKNSVRKFTLSWSKSTSYSQRQSSSEEPVASKMNEE